MTVPLFPRVDFAPEPYTGASPTVRRADERYRRRRAQEFSDEPAQLTERQVNFYQNLIRLALAVGSRDLPVEFEIHDGTRMYLDRGCIKIAEHARFIVPLENNDELGTVGHVTLAWRVERSSG